MFLGTSRKGPVSNLGSFGMPNTRSEMMLRWISSVPPAMEVAGTETKISAIVPPRGLSCPVSITSVCVINVCTCAQARAILLAASLPSDPSGPWGRPCCWAARARRAVHSADLERMSSLAIS